MAVMGMEFRIPRYVFMDQKHDIRVSVSDADNQVIRDELGETGSVMTTLAKPDLLQGDQVRGIVSDLLQEAVTPFPTEVRSPHVECAEHHGGFAGSRVHMHVITVADERPGICPLLHWGGGVGGAYGWPDIGVKRWWGGAGRPGPLHANIRVAMVLMGGPLLNPCVVMFPRTHIT